MVTRQGTGAPLRPSGHPRISFSLRLDRTFHFLVAKPRAVPASCDASRKRTGHHERHLDHVRLVRGLRSRARRPADRTRGRRGAPDVRRTRRHRPPAGGRTPGRTRRRPLAGGPAGGPQHGRLRGLSRRPAARRHRRPAQPGVSSRPQRHDRPRRRSGPRDRRGGRAGPRRPARPGRRAVGRAGAGAARRPGARTPGVHGRTRRPRIHPVHLRVDGTAQGRAHRPPQRLCLSEPRHRALRAGSGRPRLPDLRPDLRPVGLRHVRRLGRRRHPRRARQGGPAVAGAVRQPAGHHALELRPVRGVHRPAAARAEARRHADAALEPVLRRGPDAEPCTGLAGRGPRLRPGEHLRPDRDDRRRGRSSGCRPTPTTGPVRPTARCRSGRPTPVRSTSSSARTAARPSTANCACAARSASPAIWTRPTTSAGSCPSTASGPSRTTVRSR